MLRSFADTTLTDIMLDRLFLLKMAGHEVFFAGYDAIFREKAADRMVPFVQRTRESAEARSAAAVLSYLKDVEFDRLLFVNACLPFLRNSTIEWFLRQAGDGPAFAVTEVRNYFMDQRNRPVNFPSSLVSMDTGTVAPLRCFAHALYLFDRRRFLEEGSMWDWAEVKYVALPNSLEMWDIDEEWQFEAAAAVWREQQASYSSRKRMAGDAVREE